MLAGCSVLSRNLSASSAIGLCLIGCESSPSLFASRHFSSCALLPSSLLAETSPPPSYPSRRGQQSQRGFHWSSVSERDIHRKYLRGIPHPAAHNRAKIDDSIATTKAQPRYARSEQVSFEELYLVCRDGLVHKGQTPSLQRIVALLDKVKSDEQFDKTIVVLKHLQRQLWDFPPSVANAFINAGLRIDQEDKVLKALHRSVLDRNTSDEEPFYRMFPQPPSYARLIERYRAKGDSASALRVFSIASSQFRDNPDNSAKWNQVYCLGMRIYMDKKRFDQAIKVHREARYLGLHELPQMLVMRMRIEAMAEQPRIDWLQHMRGRLLTCGAETQQGIAWAEATALIAYADNNASGFSSQVPEQYLPAVPRFLSTILDPERVRSIWPLTKEEEDYDPELAKKERLETRLKEKIRQLKQNPFYAHYSPDLIKLILTRYADDRSGANIYSPAFPKPTHLSHRMREIDVSAEN